MELYKENVDSLYTFFVTANLNLASATLKFCDFVGRGFFCIKLNKISGMSIQYKISKNNEFVRFHLNHMSTFRT